VSLLMSEKRESITMEITRSENVYFYMIGERVKLNNKYVSKS